MNDITIVGHVITLLDEFETKKKGSPEQPDIWAIFEVVVITPPDREVPEIIHKVVALPPLDDALDSLNLVEGDVVVVVGTHRINPALDRSHVKHPQLMLDRPELVIEAHVIARDPILAGQQQLDEKHLKDFS